MKKLTLILLFPFALSAQTKHTVQVSDFNFTPSNITINAGDTVQWTNTGGIHNVNGTQAVYPSNAEYFTSGAPDSSLWSYSKVFTVVGTNDYTDNMNVGFMAGYITVNAVVPNGVIDVTKVKPELPIEIYNLSGQRLSTPPQQGMYIIKQGSEIQKLVK